MSFWNIRYCQLFKDPAPGTKICDLPMGSILEDLEQSSGHYSLVSFRTAKTFMGWVRKDYLEPIVYEFPLSYEIPSATPNPQDGAQYMVWKNNVQYNLCGEMCVAHVFDDNIETMLELWEAKPISLFKHVFGNGKARGTNEFELINMAGCYPSRVVTAREMLYNQLDGRMLYSPGIFARILEEGWKAILSVHIETTRGRLRSNGTLHWVALAQVIPDGIANGWVTLYNPFPHRLERYAWEDFAASMGTPYGIFLRPSPNP